MALTAMRNDRTGHMMGNRHRQIFPRLIFRFSLCVSVSLWQIPADMHFFFAPFASLRFNRISFHNCRS